MLEKIKQEYFDRSTQIILIDKENTILDSDHRLFKLKTGTYLHDFHAFFFTLLDAFESDEKTQYFPSIKFEREGEDLFLDVNFTRESDDKASIILNDCTKYYKDLHQIYQIRNESILKYRISEENNRVLEEQRNFKNKFLSTISHEIRTPINAIKGFLEILTLTELSQEQLDLVNIIQNSSNNLISLIDDLIDISRIEAGKLKIDSKRFDFKAMISALEETYSLKCREKGIEFKLAIPKSIPQYLVGDDLRINQILINLLENALKYTTSGHIELRANIKKQTSSTIDLKFEVQDTGYGISDKEMENIFIMFDRLKRGINVEGSGLGLSIAKQLADLMNADISVASKVDEGSTFGLDIKLKISHNQSKSRKRKSKSLTELEPDKKFRILMAEDIEINQMLIMKMFRTHPEYSLDLAKNGEIALRLIKEREYDLILADLTMPIMDGLDLTHHIRTSENPKISKIPIVALTAHASNDEKEQTLAASVNAYLVKPVNSALLFETVAEQIKKSKRSRK
ncbi:ATP-binding protein [Leeuwenhoekiella sp. A16]|uniref:ATP-binding protein n=1 Tax=unclassified Leeuwenhoekiella TaxID=2615029 RepID=UPI003A80B6C2